MAVFRKSANFNSPPIFLAITSIKLYHNSAHIRCSRTRTYVAIDMALLKYLLREGPVLKCSTLSKKETEQVNECVRRALDEEAKVSKKRSATSSTYTDYAPKDRQ